jgi:hypothetical protein
MAYQILILDNHDKKLAVLAYRDRNHAILESPMIPTKFPLAATVADLMIEGEPRFSATEWVDECAKEIQRVKDERAALEARRTGPTLEELAAKRAGSSERRLPDDFTCEICDRVLNFGSPYSGGKCECGQEYAYFEDVVMVLNPAQIKLLRES